MTGSHPSSGIGPLYLALMDRINNWIIRLCGLFFAIMVVSIFISILVRFIFSHLAFNISVPWTEELSRYLLIWSVFLAGGVGTRTGELIGIDVLMKAVPATLGRFSKYLAHGLSLAFYLVLISIGWEWTSFGQVERSPVMDIPMATVDAAMIVGAVLMVLNTVALIVEARLHHRDIRFASSPEEDMEAMMAEYAQDEAQKEAAK